MRHRPAPWSSVSNGWRDRGTGRARCACSGTGPCCPRATPRGLRCRSGSTTPDGSCCSPHRRLLRRPGSAMRSPGGDATNGGRRGPAPDRRPHRWHVGLARSRRRLGGDDLPAHGVARCVQTSPDVGGAAAPAGAPVRGSPACGDGRVAAPQIHRAHGPAGRRGAPRRGCRRRCDGARTPPKRRWSASTVVRPAGQVPRWSATVAVVLALVAGVVRGATTGRRPAQRRHRREPGAARRGRSRHRPAARACGWASRPTSCTPTRAPVRVSSTP